MGKGNRGFKPQGCPNPVLLAKLTRAPTPSGPSIRDRLDRDRPTWQDLKKAAQKKEQGTSEFLEKWESEQFQKELEAYRELRTGKQEKQQLKEVSRQAKRRALGSDRSSSADSSRDHKDRKSDRKKRDEKKRSKGQRDESPRVERRKRRRKHHEEKEEGFHPHKMSSFMKMVERGL